MFFITYMAVNSYMKSRYSILSMPLLAFVSLALLQGCATSNDVMSDRGIQKRKYRSGFYVSNHGNSAVAKVTAPDAQVNVATQEETQQAAYPIDQPLLPEIEQRDYTATQVVIDDLQPSKESSQRAFTQKPNDLSLNMEVYESPHPAVQAESQLNYIFEQANGEKTSSDAEFIVIVILCFLLPPLAVFLLHGISAQFWISLLLTILFWVPGVIYALYLTLTKY